uniref:Atherin-like n=2 Tax=Petromyzon marinus TaxID=7757 RepID=A0AAJ7XGM6_PETMA|nr:atherin-like [Petromyzon marinus]
MASCVKTVLWLLGILLIHRGDQPAMSAIDNATTTFYEMINNNNNSNHQSSLRDGEDAVAFDASSPATSHAAWGREPIRPRGGRARRIEDDAARTNETSAVYNVQAQRPFGRLPLWAKVKTSDRLNVLCQVVITLVQLWFSVRRKKPTMLVAPIVGRVRGHRQALAPALRAAAARRRRARNAASKRGRNQAHVPQPPLLPTPPAPAETSAEDPCQLSPPMPTLPVPAETSAEDPCQLSPPMPTPPVPAETSAEDPCQLSPPMPTPPVPAETKSHDPCQLSPPPLMPTLPAPAKTSARDASQRGIPSLMSIVTSPPGTSARDGYRGQKTPLLVTPPQSTAATAATTTDAPAGAGPPVWFARPRRTRRRRRPRRDAEDVPPWLKYRDPNGFTLT